MEALATVGTLIPALPRAGFVRCPLLLFRVDLLVFDEAGAVRVALPAVHASVGSLPGVASLVSRKVGAQPKALLALEAAVGFLPSVDPPVGEEV